MANYFTDRAVQYPGRVKLIPTGNENEYDLTRAEGTVTTEGTPFNAATFNGIAQDILDKITALEGRLNLTPVRFSGTRNSSFSAGSCTGVFDRVTGIVRITFGFTSTANVASGTTLFTIPEAYRPSSAANGTAFFGLASGTGASGCTLRADGVITQNLSSTVRTGFGYIEYSLA